MLSAPAPVGEPLEDIRHVILDRDGVLNEEASNGGYIRDSQCFHWLPGALRGLARLRGLGLRISIATNQSGIGRGLLSEAALHAIHQTMVREAQEAQASIDAVFYCPHAPNARCDCRKPAPGLINTAIASAGIPAKQTLIIGDDLKDLEAARSAGVRAVLVRTGKGHQFESTAVANNIAVFDNLEAVALSLSERDNSPCGA